MLVAGGDPIRQPVFVDHRFPHVPDFRAVERLAVVVYHLVEELVAVPNPDLVVRIGGQRVEHRSDKTEAILLEEVGVQRLQPVGKAVMVHGGIAPENIDPSLGPVLFVDDGGNVEVLPDERRVHLVCRVDQRGVRGALRVHVDFVWIARHGRFCGDLSVVRMW